MAVYRWAGCCAGVMRCVRRTSRFFLAMFVSPGNSSRWLSGALPPAMNFTLGTVSGAKKPGVDSDVTPSCRTLFMQSRKSQ